jgi:hypothetical protein
MLALALLVATTACSGDDPASVSPVSTGPSSETAVAGPFPTVEDVPGPVAQTRAAILGAAAAKDYDALEPLVDVESFLSDAGFGEDPLAHWRDQGTAPLVAMVALLSLPHTVQETNEGALYRWPRFTADSDPADLSEPEREALTSLLGERGLARAFTSETGYIAPRLGILADGTWFFFVQNPAP